MTDLATQGNATAAAAAESKNGERDGHAVMTDSRREEKVLNTLSKITLPTFSGSGKDYRTWSIQLKANLEYVYGERLVELVESVDPLPRFSAQWNIRAVSIIFSKLLTAMPPADKSMILTCAKWTNANLGADTNGRRFANGDNIVEVTNLPHPYFALARLEEKYAPLNPARARNLEENLRLQRITKPSDFESTKVTIDETLAELSSMGMNFTEDQKVGFMLSAIPAEDEHLHVIISMDTQLRNYERLCTKLRIYYETKAQLEKKLDANSAKNVSIAHTTTFTPNMGRERENLHQVPDRNE